jgi:phosphate transport system protein
MNSEHTVKSFDSELAQLTDTLLQMGRLTEQQLSTAIEALSLRSSETAEQVIREDQQIDQLKDQVTEQVLNLIALRQPVAADLRLIVSALTMATDFERIGDHAASAAKRSLKMLDAGAAPPLETFLRLASIVLNRLHNIVTAFTNLDSALAMDVWRRDSEVDTVHTSLYREMLTYMMEDPRKITACTHLLFAAKSLERIGDHATNIAELVCFLKDGRRPRGQRPRAPDETIATEPSGSTG